MNHRLRTSKKTEEQLKTLQKSLHLQPNLIARLAVSLSLSDPSSVMPDDHHDQLGLEFNRVTLTGEYDSVYKALIIQHTNHPLPDEEYFPGYLKAHLERGVSLLENAYQYAGNYEKFVLQLSSLGGEV